MFLVFFSFSEQTRFNFFWFISIHSVNRLVFLIHNQRSEFKRKLNNIKKTENKKTLNKTWKKKFPSIHCCCRRIYSLKTAFSETQQLLAKIFSHVFKIKFIISLQHIQFFPSVSSVQHLVGGIKLNSTIQ